MPALHLLDHACQLDDLMEAIDAFEERCWKLDESAWKAVEENYREDDQSEA